MLLGIYLAPFIWVIKTFLEVYWLQLIEVDWKWPLFDWLRTVQTQEAFAKLTPQQQQLLLQMMLKQQLNPQVAAAPVSQQQQQQKTNALNRWVYICSVTSVWIEEFYHSQSMLTSSYSMVLCVAMAKIVLVWNHSHLSLSNQMWQWVGHLTTGSGK